MVITVTPSAGILATQVGRTISKEKNKEIAEAIESGNYHSVEKFIQENPGQIQFVKYGLWLEPALMIATKKNDRRMMKLLLDNGVNVDQSNTHGFTALDVAIEYDNTKAVRLLLDYGANMHKFNDKTEQTPFIKSARTSEFNPKRKEIADLFNRYESIKAITPTKQLWQALNDRDEAESMRLLSQTNPDGIPLVDVNERTDNFYDKKTNLPLDGYTALMLAVDFKLVSVARYLLSLKKSDGSLLVDVNVSIPFDRSTVLMESIKLKEYDIVLDLLSLKKSDGSLIVNINAVSSQGYTAFQRALLNFYHDSSVSPVLIKVIKTLLLHGADIMIPPARGYGNLNIHLLSKAPEFKSLLQVFDALLPDVDVQALSKDTPNIFSEADIVAAYDEFLHGRHQELRDLLLIHPQVLIKAYKKSPDALITPLAVAIKHVFQPESIKPLLYFLAETKRQREFADFLIEKISMWTSGSKP